MKKFKCCTKGIVCTIKRQDLASSFCTETKAPYSDSDSDAQIDRGEPKFLAYFAAHYLVYLGDQASPSHTSYPFVSIAFFVYAKETRKEIHGALVKQIDVNSVSPVTCTAKELYGLKSVYKMRARKGSERLIESMNNTHSYFYFNPEYNWLWVQRAKLTRRMVLYLRYITNEFKLFGCVNRNSVDETFIKHLIERPCDSCKEMRQQYHVDDATGRICFNNVRDIVRLGRIQSQPVL